MKTKTCILAILLAAGLTSSRAQGTWTRKADFGGNEREYAAAFSIGSKGYMGMGGGAYPILYRDFWEYDPVADAWTQKADFGGGNRANTASFTIGNKGYVGTGGAIDSYRRDLWEYDPAANTWTQKADFGGSARFGAVGFSIGTKGYIGTGINGGCCPFNLLKDVWEYDPTTDTWTQKTDFGGGLRGWATSFTIGNKGYVGTGDDATGPLRDFWEFDPIANTWLQKAAFGGNEREFAVGFSIGSNGYIGTGGNTTGALRDFWAYEPTANTWTRKTDFGGSARRDAKGFSVGSKGYVGTGADSSAFYKDFWEYTPAATATPTPTPTITPTPTCTPPPPNMISWWPGDGNANDIQDGNDGTLQNGVTFAAGKVGQAFSFDGVDDFVQASTTGLPTGNNDRTLDLWVKIDAFVAEEAFFAGYGRFGSFTQTYHLGTSRRTLFFSQWGLAVFGPSLQTGRWYHVAVSNVGNFVTLYLDGTVVNTGTLSINTPAGTQFYIGRIPGPLGDSRRLQGMVDEVEIFNRALSASEIAAIFNAGSAGKCKPIPRPITVTFNTNPSGLSYRVDGTTYNSAHVFSWLSGSSHTIATTSPQNGESGVRYVWQSWSDNGARSHTIAPTTSTAYTATFTTQYYLTMRAGAGGTVTPASGWRNKGAQVTIRATPSNGYHFAGWTGSGNGSYSGPNNPASVTMNGPITETASFIQ